MEKLGKYRIKTGMGERVERRCANCDGKGVFRVTFKDYWGKLVVTLCEECSRKEYGELKLQSRLDWPIVA